MKNLSRGDIIKFLIATVVFYLFFITNIFQVGDKIENTFSKNYLYGGDTGEISNEINNDIQKVFEEISNETGHNGATTLKTGSKIIQTKDTTIHKITGIDYNISIDLICGTNKSLCKKILFNGEYNSEEKYKYSVLIFRIALFIDKYLQVPNKLSNVLETISINKDDGNRRGYATWTKIVLNLGSIKSYSEFSQLISHEMGHIIDLGTIQGKSADYSKLFTEFGKSVFFLNDQSLNFYKISRSSETVRKSESKPDDFCSGYGMYDPFEDFAECFNTYLNHNSFFKQIAKKNSSLEKKYNFIADFFVGKFLNSNKVDLNLIKDNISRRPRDSTRING
ncbi:MAG: hypothetical protein WC872_00870 [Candidatus Absconditabacterales bacterium]